MPLWSKVAESTNAVKNQLTIHILSDLFPHLPPKYIQYTDTNSLSTISSPFHISPTILVDTTSVPSSNHGSLFTIQHHLLHHLPLRLRHLRHHSLDLLRPAIGFGKEKMSHLHFYFHDIVSSRTDNKQMASMFGTVFMMDNALTEGPEPASKMAGRAQGLYASAS